jgi:hypothetical protein
MTANESIAVEDYANGTERIRENRPRASSASRPTTANSDSNTARIDDPMPNISEKISPTKRDRPSGEYSTPTKRSSRLPSSTASVDIISPEPVFPIFQERKHRISLLIQVWLFVAGLYTRAEVYSDAKGAIDEAADLVQALETQVAQQDSSSVKAFAARGWGGGKSVEELWADIWAQV